MRAPSAVLFDACGILFDFFSVGALVERFFPGQGSAPAATCAAGWLASPHPALFLVPPLASKDHHD